MLHGVLTGLVLALVLIAGVLVENFMPAAARIEAHEGRPAAGDEVLQPQPAANPPKPSMPLKKFKYYKTVHSKVTAYTPGVESCGDSSDGITSTGINAWNLTGVATAPKALPYGSWVYIPGIGYREVDDTGSAMREAWDTEGEIHIDLRFDSVDRARKWGVQHLNVHVFVPEEPH